MNRRQLLRLAVLSPLAPKVVAAMPALAPVTAPIDPFDEITKEMAAAVRRVQAQLAEQVYGERLIACTPMTLSFSRGSWGSLARFEP